MNIMEGYADSVELYEGALKSAGTSQKKFDLYMEGTEAKLNTFKNTWADLWNSTFQTDTIQTTIAVLTGLTKALQVSVNTFGGFGTILGIATTGLLLFNKTLRMRMLTMFNIDLKAVALSTKIFTGSTIAARAAVIGLQASMTLGLSLAIAGVVAGISHLVSKYQEQKKLQEEISAQNKKITDSWINQKETISELLVEYSKLRDLTKNGTLFSNIEQETRYHEIVTQLSDLMPSLVASIDAKGEKHLKNADAIRQELEYAEKLANLEQNQQVLDAESNFGKQIDGIDKLKDKIIGLQTQIAMGGTFAGTTFLPYSESDLNKIEYQLLSLQQQVSTSTSIIKDNVKSLISSILTVNDVKIDDNMSAEIEKIVSSLNVDGLDKSTLVDKSNAIAGFVGSINSLSKVNSFAEGEKLSKAIYASGEAIGFSKAKISQLIDEYLLLAKSQFDVSKEAEKATVSQEELDKNFKDTISSLSSLSSSYDTLSKGEEISADNVIDLINKYPTLSKYLAETNDLTFKKGELLKEVAEADRQTRIVEFENSLKAVEVTRNELTAKQELYKQFFQKLVDTGSPMDNWTVGSVLTNEEESALNAANQQANDLKAKIAALSQPLNFYSGGSSSKSKKDSSSSSASKDEAKLQSITESRINSINAQALAQSKLNDTLSSSISTDSSLATQMSKTTALIASQTKETSLLEEANKKLLSERGNLQKSNSKYDMSSWIDANGEATESYVNLFNSMKSGTAQSSLQSLYDQFSQYTLAIRENKSSINEIVANNSILTKSLDDLKLSSTQAYLEKRDASISAYDSELETSNLVKSLLDEETNAYGREIANQIAILKNKGKALEEDSAWIINRLESNKKAAKSDKLTAAQIDELTNRLKLNSKSVLENKVAVKQSIDSYDEWAKSIKATALDSANSFIEAQKKIDQYNLSQQEKQLNAYKQAQQDKIDNIDAEIDMLRKKWELEEEIAERNEFTSEISRLNQVTAILQNNTLASISDELAEQLKIEELKKKEIEYQNDLLEKQKEIQTIQAEKNVRLFENGEFSWVADPRKVKDVQEQIKDMEESYNEGRKNDLDSILNDLKGKEEAYADWQKQKDRDAMIALLEQRKEAIEAETALREEKFALEQEAFNSHYEHMDILAAQYLDQLKNTYGSKWDEILGVLQGKLSSAEDMYNKLRGYSGESLNSSGASVKTSSSVSQMQENSIAWGKASATEKVKLHENNKAIADSMGAVYDSKTGKWLKDGIPLYHEGGIVGENKSISSWITQKFGLKNNETIAKLMNGEMVVKNPANMIQNFMSGIKIHQPNFAGMSPSQSSSIDKSENFNFYGNITVKANDATQFMNNLKLQVKNKY